MHHYRDDYFLRGLDEAAQMLADYGKKLVVCLGCGNSYRRISGWSDHDCVPTKA